MSDPRLKLAERLGHRFADTVLLDRALNHRSARGASNERLEFLGDAVLDTVISHQLIQRFTHVDEGVLSRLRARLVCDAALADVARQLDIGPLVALGSGELKSGGARRDSILADAFEATIGAVFLDGGYADAERVVNTVFAARLNALRIEDARKDAKTELQEWLQGRGYGLPDYALLKATGPDHDRRFLVCCEVASLGVQAEATAGSRRAAEQAAAELVLQELDRA